MSRPRPYVFLALIFSLVTSLISPAAFASGKTIQIKGSDTMVNLGQSWAEEFMAAHPDQSIAVTGGGSGTGIAAIISGTCDISQSSRSMTQDEKDKAQAKGSKIIETTVGYDGIAIVVHPSNPVNNLTIAQLADIYTGKVTNWSEVGGVSQEILVTSRERNSGTHVFFLEHVLRKGNAKGPEEFSDHVLMMPSSQAIVQEVKGSEAAIGYVGLGYVTKDMKVIHVGTAPEGPFVAPTIDTIHDNSYSISRPLYFYTREDNADVKAFIDFAVSPEGQEIVRLLDFVPLEH